MFPKLFPLSETIRNKSRSWRGGRSTDSGNKGHLAPEQPLKWSSTLAEILWGKLRAALMVLLRSSQAVLKARKTFKTCMWELLSSQKACVGLGDTTRVLNIHCIWNTLFILPGVLQQTSFISFCIISTKRECVGFKIASLENSRPFHYFQFLPTGYLRDFYEFLKLECKLHTWCNKQYLSRSNAKVTF